MGPAIKFTNRLVLRVESEAAASHVLDLYKRNIDCFERFEPTRPASFYTEDYHRVSLHREYIAYLSGSFIRYYIYEGEHPSTIIGSINVNFYTLPHQQFAEIGYKIDHSYQNKGYAFEACEAVIDVIKASYNMKKLYARIHPENEASKHLATKLGFAPIGIEKNAANILGKDVDLIRYCLDISSTQ